MNVVLDTCALIWSVLSPGALTRAAAGAITDEEAEVWVSPISCAEIACAVERGRLMLDRHWKVWFRHFVEANEWPTASSSPPPASCAVRS